MKRALILSALCAALAAAPAGWAQTSVPPLPAGAVRLDHVVAAIGNNVILESDVREEMRLSVLEPLRVLPGENTPGRALRRLINRTLILEQMKVQQQPVTAPPAQVQKSIQQLRGEIPACVRYRCQSDAGWNAFLQAHDLTPELVAERWSQRLAILTFIDIRFRSGIRISKEQIADYYNKTLVPALAKEHEPAPALALVAPRIEEILLQQHVSSLFRDWLESLRDQGNVRVIDPAYSADFRSERRERGGQSQ